MIKLADILPNIQRALSSKLRCYSHRKRKIWSLSVSLRRLKISSFISKQYRDRRKIVIWLFHLSRSYSRPEFKLLLTKLAFVPRHESLRCKVQKQALKWGWKSHTLLFHFHQQMAFFTHIIVVSPERVTKFGCTNHCSRMLRGGWTKAWKGGPKPRENTGCPFQGECALFVFLVLGSEVRWSSMTKGKLQASTFKCCFNLWIQILL